MLDRLLKTATGFIPTPTIGDPALDDPDHIEGEPELTTEDLAGRLDDAEPLTSHTNLRDDAQ